MEIKVLGICGSPIKGGNTEVFLKEALKAAEETGDVRTELLQLAGKDIKDCRHCNWCMFRQEEGKFCNVNDDMIPLFPRIIESDAIMIATPVYMTRPTGYLSCFFDRWRCIGHGKHYKQMLENKVGAALAVAWYRHQGMETALQAIVSSFMLTSMLPVNCGGFGIGSQYGACGVTSQGGEGKFDPKVKLGILQDEYGLFSARCIGKRTAEVAKIVKSGKTTLPSPEPAGKSQ